MAEEAGLLKNNLPASGIADDRGISGRDNEKKTAKPGREEYSLRDLIAS